MSNDQQPAGIVPWTPPDPAEAAQILADCAASARAAAIEHDRITGAGGKASGVRAVLDECAAAMDGAAEQWRRFVPYAARTVRTAGPLPVLDDASTAAAGEAYATRHQPVPGRPLVDQVPGYLVNLVLAIMPPDPRTLTGPAPGTPADTAQRRANAQRVADHVWRAGWTDGARWGLSRVPTRVELPADASIPPALLPTPAETIANADTLLSTAYRALGDAGDELRSDWRPGTSLTGEQAGQRARMQQAITKAKAAINEGRR